MKVRHEISADQYADLRRSIRNAEMAGIDPGTYWAGLYPEATEVEFVVAAPEDESQIPTSGDA